MGFIQINLKSIECIKTNETGEDELYAVVFIKERDEHGIDSNTRFPRTENGFWKFSKGQKEIFDETFFVGDIHKGIDFHIRFVEEDVSSGSRIFVPDAVKELIDDFIGEIFVKADKTATISIEAGENSKIKAAENETYLVSMTGSGAGYLVEFEIK